MGLFLLDQFNICKQTFTAMHVEDLSAQFT
jgi:hypothetical protein